MSCHSRSRSASPASSDSSSGMSMPMLRKEVDENPEEGSSDRRSRASSSMSSEYRFRLQLMTDNSNDIPPPISPNSTAFDPFLRRGQVKIIRTGDTMHVMTYEECGKPMITSYAKPLSQSWYDTSPRPRLDTSPIRPKFKLEGESAIRTISRYCFPSCIEAQLDNLTLQEILIQAQLLAEKWVNARDSGLNESQRHFLKNQFSQAKLETVVMKDWETLSDIFEAHNEWKIEQSRVCSFPTVQEVSFKRSACFKTLPRHRLAKKRKEDLKNYDSFVDLGERVDLASLRKKRGMPHTYVLNAEKVGSLLRKSMFYGSNESLDLNSKKPTSNDCLTSKAKSKLPTKVDKKKAIKAPRPKSVKMDVSSDKLNPRRDKPMAKIRSQVRQVDRFARLNGESYHNAALTLSKSRGLSGSPGRKITPQDLEMLRQARVLDSDVNNLQETDLDLGLEGVCFDADLTELTNSVMDGNVLEDLVLGRDPVDLNFANSSEPSGSMVVALHAGIDYGSEFAEPFTSKSFPDIVSMDDGLLEAIDTTLGADIDVTNLMESNPSTTKEEIFLMTGLTPAEHKAFENLENQLIEDSNQKRTYSKSKSPERNDAPGAPTPNSPNPNVPVTKPAMAPTSGDLDTQNDTSTVTANPLNPDNNNDISNSNKPVDTEKRDDIISDSVSNSPPVSTLNPPSSLIPETRTATLSTNNVENDSNSSQEPVTTLNSPSPSKCPSSTSNHSNPTALSRKSDTITNSNIRTDSNSVRSQRRTVRKSLPATLITNEETITSNPNDPGVSKKAQSLLECSLTGSYWQIPENKFPCNRPKRANAGALMTTKSKSGLRRRGNSVNYLKIAGGACGKQKNARLSGKIITGKFTNKHLRETSLSPDGMIVSKKTAFRCITSIPDFICPTPHEEFLLKYRKWFVEVDLKELQDLIIKSRPKIESAARKCGMDKYLQGLARKNKGRQGQQAAATAALNSAVTAEEVPTTETKPKAQSVKSVKEIVVKEKESLPKPKAYSGKRKFEEDEKTEITKLGGNQILVDGLILNVNYEDYVKEKDVEIPYDEYNFETKENLPVIPTTSDQPSTEDPNVNCKTGPCKLPYCTLGCVCGSIDSQVSEAKHHCGKMKCMLECSCNVTNWNKEDADIRSRLRPRVSMLNWNSRLNYLDAFISPDKEKEPATKSSDSRSSSSSQTQGGRIKRNIVPPKRNNDFVSHLSHKKGRDEIVRPSARQGSKMSAFKHIGNKLRLKQRQRQPFLRPLKNTNIKEETILRNKKSPVPRLKLDSPPISKPEDPRDETNANTVKSTTVSRLSHLQKRSIRQRTLMQSSLEAVRSRVQYSGVALSVEGTGPKIPPEIMAKFAPFMEIRYRPKPDKCVPLVSESEDSTDDENDEEYANLTYKMNPNPVIMQEEAFPTPVIVSYKSCQEGFSDVIRPENLQ